MALPKVGDKAPDFKSINQNGEEVKLSALKEPVVLYFYPKDDTPGCTVEACAFRDAYEAFTDAGATVIGVSSDTVEELARFAASNRLPFTLLSDADGAVRRTWGVPKDLFVLPGRVTYILDTQGIVRHVFRSAVKMSKHAEEAVRAVRELTGRGG